MINFKKFLLFLTAITWQFYALPAANFGFGADSTNLSQNLQSLTNLVDEQDKKLESENYDLAPSNTTIANPKVNNKRRLSVNDEAENKEKKYKNENVDEANAPKITLEQANFLLLEGSQNLDKLEIDKALKGGANINATIDGETVLGRALKLCNIYNPKILRILKYLIDTGADVNAMTKGSVDGPITPLIIACYWNCYEIAELLMSKGANVNLACHKGYTPLSNLIVGVSISSYYKDNINFFNNLIGCSDLNKIVKLKYEKETTPLFYASDRYSNCLENSKKTIKNIIEIMIKNGADIFAKDSNGESFLGKCRDEVKTMLLDKYYEQVKFGNQLTQLLRTEGLLPEVLNRMVLSYLNLDNQTYGNSQQIVSADMVNKEA